MRICWASGPFTVDSLVDFASPDFDDSSVCEYDEYCLEYADEESYESLIDDDEAEDDAELELCTSSVPGGKATSVTGPSCGTSSAPSWILCGSRIWSGVCIDDEGDGDD